jgi:hypothetical protein
MSRKKTLIYIYALSLVSTIEEILERKSSGSSPETENMVVGDLPS